MKIALVYLGRRGSGPAFSLQLAGALAKIGQVHAYISTFAANLSAWQESNLEFTALPTFESPSQALRYSLFPQRINQIVSEIEAFAPQVLVFCMFHPWNGMLQRRLPHIPSLVIVHDPQPHPGLLPRLHRLGEDYSLRAADIAMVLSHSLAPELARRGVPSERVFATRHGLLSSSQERDSFVPAPLDQRHVLFFGRITEYKGLEILLPAWAHVQSAVLGAQLTIAGGGSLKLYQRWLKDLPDVEVINRWVDDQESRVLFRRTNLVVLPYTSASQSAVVLLAAEVGRAVIATRVGGLPEQIQDGQTGILIAPGNVKALSEALISLLRDPQRAQQLGQQLWFDYRKNFDWSHIADDVLAACQSAIDRPREGK